MLVRRSTDVNEFLPFRPRPYAVHQPDGSASRPVCFDEGQEVLRRLAKKLWPGHICMYMRVDDTATRQKTRNNDPIKEGAVSTTLSAATHIRFPKELLVEHDGNSYVRLSNPAHPLASRLLKEVKNGRVVLAAPIKPRDKTFTTNAIDSCNHFVSQQERQLGRNGSRTHSQTSSLLEAETIHVLNGEDKRELFVVPTCQHQRPCPFALWIDTVARCVYIRGERWTSSRTETKFSSSDLHRLLGAHHLATKGDRFRNRPRVVAAVLRKWQIVDERTNPTTNKDISS